MCFQVSIKNGTKVLIGFQLTRQFSIFPSPKNRDQSRLDDGYSSLFLSPANYNSFPSPSAAKSLDTVTKRPKGSTAVL